MAQRAREGWRDDLVFQYAREQKIYDTTAKSQYVARKIDLH